MARGKNGGGLLMSGKLGGGTDMLKKGVETGPEQAEEALLTIVGRGKEQTDGDPAVMGFPLQ